MFDFGDWGLFDFVVELLLLISDDVVFVVLVEVECVLMWVWFEVGLGDFFEFVSVGVEVLDVGSFDCFVLICGVW